MLQLYAKKTITLLTCDGRLITGTLLGYDQLQNLILSSSYERVYSMDCPMEKVELGLFVVRGDNVAVVGDCGGLEDGEDDDGVNREGGVGGGGGGANGKGDNGGGGGGKKGKMRINDEDIRAEPILPIAQNVT